MSTTRERKIEFIEHQFSYLEDERIMLSLFRRAGLDWLVDEQLEAIINEWLEVQKQTRRMNRQNREIASARRAGDTA